MLFAVNNFGPHALSVFTTQRSTLYNGNACVRMLNVAEKSMASLAARPDVIN